MEIVIYGKENCPLCEKAKKLVEKAGHKYKYEAAEYFTSYHEGWREDGSVEVKAFSELTSGHLPIIKIDNKFYDFEGLQTIIS